MSQLEGGGSSVAHGVHNNYYNNNNDGIVADVRVEGDQNTTMLRTF